MTPSGGAELSADTEDSLTVQNAAGESEILTEAGTDSDSEEAEAESVADGTEDESSSICAHGNSEDECLICQIEEQIDALPSLTDVRSMTTEDRNEVYAQTSAICDLYYDELTEEEQEQVSNIDTLWDLLDYFSGAVMLTDGDSGVEVLFDIDIFKSNSSSYNPYSYYTWALSIKEQTAAEWTYYTDDELDLPVVTLELDTSYFFVFVYAINIKDTVYIKGTLTVDSSGDVDFNIKETSPYIYTATKQIVAGYAGEAGVYDAADAGYTDYCDIFLYLGGYYVSGSTSNNVVLKLVTPTTGTCYLYFKDGDDYDGALITSSWIWSNARYHFYFRRGKAATYSYSVASDGYETAAGTITVNKDGSSITDYMLEENYGGGADISDVINQTTYTSGSCTNNELDFTLVSSAAKSVTVTLQDTTDNGATVTLYKLADDDSESAEVEAYDAENGIYQLEIPDEGEDTYYCVFSADGNLSWTCYFTINADGVMTLTDDTLSSAKTGLVNYKFNTDACTITVALIPQSDTGSVSYLSDTYSDGVHILSEYSEDTLFMLDLTDSINAYHYNVESYTTSSKLQITNNSDTDWVIVGYYCNTLKEDGTFNHDTTLRVINHMNCDLYGVEYDQGALTMKQLVEIETQIEAKFGEEGQYHSSWVSEVGNAGYTYYNYLVYWYKTYSVTHTGETYIEGDYSEITSLTEVSLDDFAKIFYPDSTLDVWYDYPSGYRLTGMTTTELYEAVSDGSVYASDSMGYAPYEVDSQLDEMIKEVAYTYNYSFTLNSEKEDSEDKITTTTSSGSTQTNYYFTYLQYQEGMFTDDDENVAYVLDLLNYDSGELAVLEAGDSITLENVKYRVEINGYYSNVFQERDFIVEFGLIYAPLGTLNIVKVDEEGNPLSDVTFTLTKSDEDSDASDTDTDSDSDTDTDNDDDDDDTDADSDKEEADVVKYTSCTTDENGECSFTGLYPGTYILKETSVPDGYVLDDTEYIVTVEVDSDTGSVDVRVSLDSEEEEKSTGTEGEETDNNKEVILSIGEKAVLTYTEGESESTLTIKNDPISIALTVIDGLYNGSGTGRMSGIRFTLTDSDGNVQTAYTDSSGNIHFGTENGTNSFAVACGQTYQLTEQSINGYYKVYSVNVTIGEDGTIESLTMTNGRVYSDTAHGTSVRANGTGSRLTVTNIRIPGSVSFTKPGLYNESCIDTEDADSDDTIALSGVTFTAYSDEDLTNVIATAVSDEDGAVSFTDLPWGTCYIKETATADGYVLDETVYTVTVSVSAGSGVTAAISVDGTVIAVTDANGVAYTAEDDSETAFTITNDVYRSDFSFTKVSEEDTSQVIAGSTYGLYRYYGSDSELTLIATAVSDENGLVTFAGLLMDQEYIVAELVAPSGSYVSANSISFNFVLESPDGTVSINWISTGSATVEGEDGDLIWKEPQTIVSILKTDETGSALAGATLQLLDAENGNSPVIVGLDENGDPITSWTSTDTAREITGILTAGHTYTLVELNAPEGYLIAEPVTFTVPDDAVAPNENEAYVVTMTDVRETEASTEESTETETPTEASTETEAPTEAATETEAPTEAATETEAPTEAETLTEAASETSTEAPTETFSEESTDAAPETSAETQMESEIQTELSTETQTESASGSDTETETETQSATDIETVSESESETSAPVTTGDDTPISSWMTVMIAAIALLLVSVIYRRRYYEK